MKKRKNEAYFRKTSIYISLTKNRRLLCCALVWGVPFAISCVLGWRLVNTGTVFGPGGSATAYAGSFFRFLLEAAVLSVLSAIPAALVLRNGGRDHSERAKGELCEISGDEQQAAGTGAKICRRHPAYQVWLFYSLLIFLCWLPVFLAYYPSVFAYDAEGQLYQVIAKDYSTHHPLLHTLFLGAFFQLGGAVGSYQTGMAVHSVVQMLLMAVAFARALVWLYEARTHRWIRFILLLFYGLFPANSILALSTTKDVLFSALVLLCTLRLYRLVSGSSLKTARFGAGDWAVYVCLASLMLLFRNNAVYAYAVSAPILYFVLRNERKNAELSNQDSRRKAVAVEKKWLLAAAVVVLLFGLSSFFLKTVTHAKDGSPREMLSVPLQQMARVRVTAEEQIDPAMRQELDKYIPADWVFAAYNPHLADPVKNRAVIHDDPVGLIKTWIRLGVRFPAIYADAFLDNSLGMWYLWDTSHAEIYGIGTESGFGYLSTDNRTMPAGCEIVERSFWPDLRAFVERIVSDNAYQKLPLVRLLFSPAFYWWLLWFYLVAAMYRRKKREALPAVFLAAYYLTLMLSPTVIVRYMYPLVVTVPVILSHPLTAESDEGWDNSQ